jgi:XTP/dITP diphosphohydrolase
MTTKFILASSNANKIKEIKAAVKNSIEIVSLEDVGINEEIPEPHNTIGENSIAKASYVYEKTLMTCVAEDTGLEIDALDGEPGAKSARYAGRHRNPKDNINKVLANLNNNPNRSARFYTVMSLCHKGKLYTFEGECKGFIEREEKGEEGFGYDPIFTPLGSSRTFAEMSLDEKQMYSHRKIALDKLISFINTGLLN